MIFADRSRGRTTRHLEWRVRAMLVGAVLGLAGIWLDSSGLIWAALAVLVGGFLLRFVPERGEGDEETGEG